MIFWIEIKSEFIGICMETNKPFITVYSNFPRVYNHNAKVNFCYHGYKGDNQRSLSGISTIIYLKRIFPDVKIIDISNLSVDDLWNQQYWKGQIVRP